MGAELTPTWPWRWWHALWRTGWRMAPGDRQGLDAAAAKCRMPSRTRGWFQPLPRAFFCSSLLQRGRGSSWCDLALCAW